MKKTKRLSLLIIGLLLIVPFIRTSTAQGDYVGIEDGNKYQWELRLYPGNWATYFADNLEDTLANLVPLDIYNLTAVYQDWSWSPTPPQSYWPITVTAIGGEESGPLLSPNDNTTITSTPINGTAGFEIPGLFNQYWDSTWYIVNDTSSFLRQTLNLSLAFSPYGMMGAPFIPTSINWALLVSEFLGVMASEGGLYNNVSAIAQSNGYTLSIPALGFENNSVAIDIDATFDSNGVLTYHQFSYGAQMLVEYILVEPSDPIFTDTPDDLTIEPGYTSASVSWTATDLNPTTYTIELQGTGIVHGPAAWSSGLAVTYNIPVGFPEGNYTYTITFSDNYGNSVNDSVVIYVETPEPSPQADIPGYDLSIVIGTSTIALISLIVLMKKKKK